MHLAMYVFFKCSSVEPFILVLVVCFFLLFCFFARHYFSDVVYGFLAVEKFVLVSPMMLALKKKMLCLVIYSMFFHRVSFSFSFHVVSPPF